MDKNIAALLRNDTKTVKVQFFRSRYDEESRTYAPAELSPKHYMYITDLNFQVDDYAVVMVSGTPRVVIIKEVHNGLNIEPNEDTKYKWIVAKVDMTAYNKNHEKNKAVEQLISTAYKDNMRAQFKNVLLTNLDESTKQQVLTTLQDDKPTR